MSTAAETIILVVHSDPAAQELLSKVLPPDRTEFRRTLTSASMLLPRSPPSFVAL